MVLTILQKLDLLHASKDSWIKSKSHWYAFSKALDDSKKKSDYLKWGTILSASLTTVSGFIEITYLTIVSGLLTTALAFVDKQFVPVENALNFADCKKQCEKYHSDLVYYAIEIDSVQDIGTGNAKLRTMEDNYKNKIDTQMGKINVSVGDESMAKDAFTGTTLDNKISQLSKQVDISVDRGITPELPEDAPSIIPVRRGVG